MIVGFVTSVKARRVTFDMLEIRMNFEFSTKPAEHTDCFFLLHARGSSALAKRKNGGFTVGLDKNNVSRVDQIQ